MRVELSLALLALGGCTETTDPPPRDAGTSEASRELADAKGPAIGFAPASYPTDCEQDTDCILVTPISECTTCCSATSAVSRRPAEQDFAATIGACGGEVTKCKQACLPLAARCDDRRCVAR